MNWIRKITFCAIAALGLATVARADVEISGAVEGLLEARLNNYLVTGDITVPVNSTLRIEPGVVIIVTGNYRFIVNGTLIALGTEALPIDIHANNARAAAWMGITMNATSRDSLRYVSIRHAYQGISVLDCDPVIDRCVFSMCDRSAVRFSLSNGQLINSVISDITGNGVAVTDDSRALIQNDTIRRCGSSGIAVDGNGIPIINSNWIEDARNHGIALSQAGNQTLITWNVILRPTNRGISVEQMGAVTIKHNGISQAGAVGIFLYRSTNAIIFNNSVLASGQHGVQFTTCTGRLSNNIIGENSRFGIAVTGNVPQCSYNDLYSNSEGDYDGVQEGQNDLHVFPMLADAAQGNFHPRADSPVIDQGDPNLELDLDGTRADVGMWFFNQNHPPRIEDWTPQDSVFQYPGDSLLVFNVQATDPDGHGLFYEWTVNGVAEERRSNTFRRTFNRDRTYLVRVTVSDQLYAGLTYHNWMITIVGAGVNVTPNLPTGYAVSEVYPNPFNGQSKVDLTLPLASETSIEVMDVSGRIAGSLFRGELTAGSHSIPLNAEALPTGRYFLVTRIGGGSAVRSFVLLK